METAPRQRRSMLAINLALWANVLLAGLKITIGIVGHSTALLADGVNSTSDVAYTAIVRIFMRLAHKPADEEHPYGHRQFESIAALVVGSFVLTTAVAIFWGAVNSAYDLWMEGGSSEGAASITLVVALFTVGLKIVLALVTRALGRQTGNPAVMAVAYDHRNDIFAAAAAGVGIFFSRQGYQWVDPAAGAVVALVILRTGIQILRDSSGDLTDSVPGRELRSQVEAVIKELPDVLQVEEVLAHRFGPFLVMNVTIGIDGKLQVFDGDEIATRVEWLLQGRIGLLQRVHVHYHPARPPGERLPPPRPPVEGSPSP